MKYIVVRFVDSYHVINTGAQTVQSSWDNQSDARDCAARLNKWNKR